MRTGTSRHAWPVQRFSAGRRQPIDIQICLRTESQPRRANEEVRRVCAETIDERDQIGRTLSGAPHRTVAREDKRSAGHPSGQKLAPDAEHFLVGGSRMMVADECEHLVQRVIIACEVTEKIRLERCEVHRPPFAT